MWPGRILFDFFFPFLKNCFLYLTSFKHAFEILNTNGIFINLNINGI